MTTLAVIDSQIYHCGAMARRLADGHAREALRCDIGTHHGLVRCFAMSTRRRTWLIDGQVQALGGITGTELSGDGHVWLVTSPLALRHKLALVKILTIELDRLLETRYRVSALVDEEESAFCRFAEFMGFRHQADLVAGFQRQRLYVRPSLALLPTMGCA